MYTVRDPTICQSQVNDPTLFVRLEYPMLRTGHHIDLDTSTTPDLKCDLCEQGSCYRWPCQLTKIFAYSAPTLPFGMQVPLGAMLEGFVPVPDIIKEMNLVLVRKESGTDAVHWSITPSLV